MKNYLLLLAASPLPVSTNRRQYPKTRKRLLFPVGSLSAFPTIVQTGTHPTLTWDITIPETIDEIIEIEPPGTIRPKRCLVMDVRVLGASVKRTWTNSKGEVVQWEWVPTESLVSYNGSALTTGYFFDVHSDVRPNFIVHSQVVQARQHDRFRGPLREIGRQSWSTLLHLDRTVPTTSLLSKTETPLRQQLHFISSLRLKVSLFPISMRTGISSSGHVT